MSNSSFSKVLFSMVVLIFFSAFVNAKNREEQQFKVEKVPTITLINYSGSISAQGWANSSVKLISIRYSENVGVDVEASSNRVDIATYVLDKMVSSEKTLVDYELYIPENSNLHIRSNIGNVFISNVRGQVTVNVVDGAVKATKIDGYLNAHSLGEKAIEVSRSKGTIQATTVRANIIFEQLRSDNVKASSTLGNIIYRGNFIDGGSYNLSSTDGSISVICTKTASVEWNARTVKGSINSNLPIRSKRHRPLFNNFQSLLGTSNKGQATVHLSTFSGKIQIKNQIPEW